MTPVGQDIPATRKVVGTQVVHQVFNTLDENAYLLLLSRNCLLMTNSGSQVPGRLMP